MERRRGLATGVLLGILGTMAARTLLPFFIPLLRPLTKQGMKAAIHGYERSREVAAHLVESASDIFAEVQAELQGEPNGAATSEARTIPLTRKPTDA
ncbi:MAG: DUF5132 domain-containing protein [Caldilinea sp. CFX5]|nr:DUF5132 domain-containing protein [Caldilinea sp. CFX5]